MPGRVAERWEADVKSARSLNASAQPGSLYEQMFEWIHPATEDD
jgi:hypothetical protein